MKGLLVSVFIVLGRELPVLKNNNSFKKKWLQIQEKEKN